MLKELRNWFQMQDGIEDGTTGTDTIPTGLAGAYPPGACGTVAPPRSLSFIVDPDAASAQSLAAVLSASGVDAAIFANGESLAAGLRRSTPELVFLDVTTHGEEAIEALHSMGNGRFVGAVQLVGTPSSPVVDAVRRMGGLHGLDMLEPIAKPLMPGMVRRVLREQKLIAPGQEPLVDLGEALANDWVEFWYQPKIDLKKRHVAGVESFVRLRHPRLGVLQPADFMAGATDDEMMILSEGALVSALRAASNFARLGISLKFAVNLSAKGLLTLPIAQMVHELGPKHHNWPGLLLDVTEAQIDQNLAEVQAVSRGLTACGALLAVDAFSGEYLSLATLGQLPIAELKLDASLVADCAVDLDRSSTCRTAIAMAHRLGCTTVGDGMEKAADMMVLQGMGCDLGQGHFFGQAMPEERLLAMMQQRAMTTASTANRARPPTRPAAPLRARWS